MHVFLIFISYL